MTRHVQREGNKLRLNSGLTFAALVVAVAAAAAPARARNQAPVVSNVTATQRTDGSKVVDIWYDLADGDGDACTITVQASGDGGTTWTVPITALSGDLGPGVLPGVGKHIVWNCLVDLPTGFGSQYKVRVQADDGTPPGMALIPAGEFQMGNCMDPNEGWSDELPLHAVYVDAFYMDTCEVTNAQYAAGLNWAWGQGGLIAVTSGVVYKYNSGTSYPYCDTTTSSSYSRITWNGTRFGVTSGKESHPMVMVSWYGLVAYANWRSGMQGKPLCYNLSDWTCNFGSGYRLPTEAEWEKAARGGTPGHRFPWSDQNTIQHARCNYYSSSNWIYDTSPTREYHPCWGAGGYPWTSPVGFFDGSLRYKADFNWPGSPTSYQTASGANGYGLHDMAGNVWEWCNDWYSSTYYSSSPGSNPTGPPSGSYRVLRGGSWNYLASHCRSASRFSYSTPDIRHSYLGFRCVLGTPGARDVHWADSPEFTVDNRGACCQPDGGCGVVFQGGCSGVWHPEWMTCEPNPCPPPGACCLDYAGGCQMLTEADCLMQAGRFRGAGSTCTAPVVCGCKGDCDCNGSVDFDDINPFVDALGGAAPCYLYNVDVNDNGVVDFDDINPFVELLNQGAECP